MKESQILRHALFLPLLCLLGTHTIAAPDVDEVEQSIVRVVIGGHGTGWVVSPGVVATNWHVASGTDRYIIIPAGTSEQYEGTLRWLGDSDRDIALIDVPGLPLEPFTIHTGDTPRGSDSFTVGFPGLGDDLAGRANTDVSVYGGTIALLVEDADGVDIIQHTNIVNAGNSGGPLLDECGRVLGLTTWGVENQQYQADFIWASVRVSELAEQMEILGIPYEDDASECVAGGSIDTSAIDNQINEQNQNIDRQSQAMENLANQLYIYGSIGAVLLVLALALALRKPRQQIVHALGNVSRRITGFNPADYTDRPVPGQKSAPSGKASAAEGITLSCNDGTRPVSLPLKVAGLKQERHGISIGRSDELVDFCINDSSLSRRHLRISHGNDGFKVEDLGSTNGSFLNGRQLQAFKPQPLKAGDSLKIGALSFSVTGESYP